MADRLEDRIRVGSESMYEASTPVEHLIPSDLAQKAGKPIPEPAITRLRPPTRRPPRRGWLSGLAAAAAILLVSVPVLFLLSEGDQQPAAPSPSLLSRSVVALLEGDSEGLHYRISIFAAQSDEGQLSPANSSVEVEVFADPSDADPIFACFAGEKTLGSSSLIDINQVLTTASLDGEYQDSSCFFGDVTFDLVWTGTGELLDGISQTGNEGESCQDRYEAAVSGTLLFSSGPITDPITVASSEATGWIADETRCSTDAQ